MQKNKNAYEKTIWRDGETIISADLLNKVEDKLVDLDSQVASVEHENQRQNFYINALYNENIDGRLSAEGEGNDLKLESSKQGLVEVEKVVGNTLVNRVSEPIRELTLNGNIDAQGTFVTTNEGVDKGLVDVMCEGNTLVNIIDCNDVLVEINNISWGQKRIDINNMKPNTTYTVISTITTIVQGSTGYIPNLEVRPDIESYSIYGANEGFKVGTFTTKDIINTPQVRLITTGGTPDQQSVKFTVIVLEGDYSDRPIPTEYFEGMKSVGEQIDGNHKVEIISNNKNLWTCGDIQQTDTFYLFTKKYPLLKAGVYTISSKCKQLYDKPPYIDFRDINGNMMTFKDLINVYNITLPKDVYQIGLYSNGYNFNTSKGNLIDFIEIQLEEGTQATSFVSHTSNKKELSLQEPLRGLPNGVKDRFVKRDGKWFIERNCAEATLLEDILTTGRWGDDNNNKRYVYVSNMLPGQKFRSYICTDKIPHTDNGYDSKYFGVCSTSVLVFCFPEEIETIEEKKELVRPYLQNGGLKVVYQLATPIYEPLEVSPELTCYDEVTHISNNSLIPSNMKVKNTGFSCKALASNETYTVVHNGGEGITSKVDTTDNMVRLNGKGKTVSDVMVLDGEISKTYGSFEGMKSTFEDKLITQEMVDAGEEKAKNLGKYKVDVKVASKNLFNKNKVSCKENSTNFNVLNNQITFSRTEGSFTQGRLYFGKYKKGSYIISFNSISMSATNLSIHCYKDSQQELSRTKIVEFYNTTGAKSKKFVLNDDMYISVETDGVNKPITLENIQIEEGTEATQYEPFKEYKTSVYLNSPLLKGDEIVWNEDGLYHYHNKSKRELNGIENWIQGKGGEFSIYGFKDIAINKAGSENEVICNRYPKGTLSDEKNSNCQVIMYNHGIQTGGQLRVVDKKYNNSEEFQNSLKESPLILTYDCEPYYEKISDNKFITEIPNNATLSIDSIIPCQNIKVSYTGNLPSVYKLENDISIIEDHNIDIIATTFDMDYKLLEFGWMLEESGIAGVDLLSTLNTAELKNRTLSRYEQAKIIIIGKAYDKETLTRQLTKYLEKEIITKTEYDELIALIEVNE